jgi:hypothetical protein
VEDWCFFDFCGASYKHISSAAYIFSQAAGMHVSRRDVGATTKEV